MFRNVRVPILGIIENMSYYQCPNCGHSAHIFGKDGAKRTAEDFNMELLGQVLLQPPASLMLSRSRLFHLLLLYASMTWNTDGWCLLKEEGSYAGMSAHVDAAGHPEFSGASCKVRCFCLTRAAACAGPAGDRHQRDV